MKNNKGFTLVEIMSVIVILGIIAIIAVVAYNKYLNDARNKDYDFMAKSVSNAASEYAMDHLGITEVTIKELYEEQYLEYPQDPSDSGKMCKGSVKITSTENLEGLDTEKYDVKLCCANFSYVYHFPGGSKELSTCE